jgi:hypothetical protein
LTRFADFSHASAAAAERGCNSLRGRHSAVQKRLAQIRSNLVDPNTAQFGVCCETKRKQSQERLSTESRPAKA